MLALLECSAQTYEWGKLGSSSAVAQYASINGLKVSDSTPYAELWMGAHPKAPSIIGAGPDKGKTLKQVLDAQPELLGAAGPKFGGELPFLFKVLSIAKALSIQAHPDKALGAQLRERDPEHYPDDNHKPEMAIALTDFEGFCGFRPPAELVQFLKEVPEFAELVGPEATAKALKELETPDYKPALRAVFSAVMNAPDAKVEELAAKLVASAAANPAKFAGGAPAGGKTLADLIVRLNKQFPNDVGLFCGGLMLNYCVLRKGEAMFLRAKDPHAYISGDIIECMAASDNVVRAGFTPKFKDVPTLVDMLTYVCAPVEEQKMKGKPFSPVNAEHVALFDPPIDEFSVVQMETSSVGTVEPTGPLIFIVTEGSGKVVGKDATYEYQPGSVFFSAQEAFKVEAAAKTVCYFAISLV